MAVMLSLLLVVGVFAGMKLDVKAESKYFTFGVGSGNFECSGGDIIRINNVPANYNIEVKYINPKNITIDTEDHCYQYSTNMRIDVKSYYKSYSTTYDFGATNGKITFQAVAEEVLPPQPSSESKGVVSSPVSTPSSHTCNFQWVTTIDPEVGMDGLEEYKCVECGAVQESHPIPASVAAVKDFYGKVKDAPANGTVTYDSAKLYTISDYLLKKMSERSDVAVTINFEYQNAKYELTFQAGTDYTPVLTDEDTMYGYFGVAAKLGLTVVAK